MAPDLLLIGGSFQEGTRWRDLIEKIVGLTFSGVVGGVAGLETGKPDLTANTLYDDQKVQIEMMNAKRPTEPFG